MAETPEELHDFYSDDCSDYHVDDECRKLDAMLKDINPEKLFKNGVKEVTIDLAGKSKKTTSLEEPRNIDKSLAYLAQDLLGRPMSRVEILNEVDKKGIFKMMRGPLKEFRAWFKLRNSLFLNIGDGYVHTYIGVIKDGPSKEKPYRTSLMSRGPLD